MDWAQTITATVAGTNGKVLEVLAHSSRGLSIRTIARLANISKTSAQVALKKWEETGLANRQDSGRSANYSLNEEHFLAPLVFALRDSFEALLARIRQEAERIEPSPESVILFGSTADRTCDPASDIDLLIIRSDPIDELDPQWAASLDSFRSRLEQFSGNTVEIVQAPYAQIRKRTASPTPFWREIQANGLLIAGRNVTGVERG